jgi:tripartite-type tricarboxylate transporter receptor subunit TctC
MLGRLFALAALAVVAASGRLAVAQDYPAKPIRMILPYAAGGVTDVMGRAIAFEMSKTMGQQVIVDNRPGASSAIGMAATAHAAPDGYTIMFTASTFTQMPYSNKNLGMDVEKDFQPITMGLSFPIVIFANPKHPSGTLAAFIAYVKANPGLPYSTSGVGSPGHVAFAVLNAHLNAGMEHVPYKGGSESTNAAAMGEVPIAVAAPQPGLGLAEQGRLRILGVTGAKRSKLMPQTPSLAELGLPVVDVKVWVGFFAPKGTPPAIVARLHKEIRAALASEAVAARARSIAMEVEDDNSPADFAAVVSQEVRMWAELYKRFNLDNGG